MHHGWVQRLHGPKTPTDLVPARLHDSTKDTKVASRSLGRLVETLNVPKVNLDRQGCHAVPNAVSVSV